MIVYDCEFEMCLPLLLAQRADQNRIRTPYMTVCMVISLLQVPYIWWIYVRMCGFGQPYQYTIYVVLADLSVG